MNAVTVPAPEEKSLRSVVGSVSPWVKLSALGSLLLIPLDVGIVFDRVAQISDDARGLLGAVVFVVLWLVSTLAVVATAFLPKLAARAFLCAFVAPSTVASVTYWAIAKRPLTYETVCVWWEERAWAGAALATHAHLLPYAASIFVVTCLALLLPPELPRVQRTALAQRSGAGRWTIPGSYVAALGVIPTLGALNVTQAGEGLNGLPVHYKGAVFLSVMALNKQIVERERANASPRISLSASRLPPPHVVVVINETIRGDFLDINKDRGVTPYLLSRRERVINFGYASSMANCSRSTHQGLRVGVNRQNPIKSQRQNPFIWQYAKLAGYKTVLVDAQDAPGRFNNNVAGFELSLIDEVRRLGDPRSDPRPWARDQKVMAMLDQLLATADREKPLFVYVVLFGVHSPYPDKYPEAATRFPVDPAIAPSLSREERMLNAYKNGVGWSVDSFFEGLFANDRRFPNTVMLYTSDHGEDLKGAVHCTVHDPDPYEGLVPLLAVTDHPAWRPKLVDAAILNKDRASHFNLVPTVLEIFGFETEGINQWHGETLFQRIEQPRRFLSRGIRINVAGVGLESKLLWQTLPDTWVSDTPRP